MPRLLAVLLAVLLALFLAIPALASPSSADKQAFRELIDGQIASFRAGDAQAAFRVVDPDLQRKFRDADRFLEVVRVGYRPVYSPRSYRYGHTVDLDGPTVGQWLHVVGPDGQSVDALYLLEQQPDGTWRTSGCVLFEPERPAV